MEKMSSTGGYQKFVSSLKHDGHHIFIVQDSGNALGRGLSLGTAICRELQANSIVLCCERANGICRSPDPVLIRTVDEVSGFLDRDEEVIFLHSLTPLLIHASAHQILRMFRKKSITDQTPSKVEFIVLQSMLKKRTESWWLPSTEIVMIDKPQTS